MPVILRPHQVAAADAVEAAFRAGCTRPLLDMCVASGKSLTFAELARREIERGGRVIIGAHTRELVTQNAEACASLGLRVGINAAALGERTWRAPVISAAIQSIYKFGPQFGPITMLCVDEAHLIGHHENGMYRDLHRTLGYPRMPGGSGTVFRLQGGSLVEGEGAPFERVVFCYSILDGIRDGYLCPAFSIGADDKMDAAKLRTRQGEYTGESQDAQMIAAMDNHVAQMVHHGADRRAWLIFEASTKAARAMAARMNEWKIPTGLVLGETPAQERAQTIEAYRTGRLRALVNLQALCLDEETEILTSDGFVGIDDMRMDRRIAAWKPDGGVEFTPPELIVRRPRGLDERMIRVGGACTPQIRVTANHRMAIQCGSGLKRIKVVAAETLLSPVWKSIPAYGTCDPERMEIATPTYLGSRSSQIRVNSCNYRKRGVPAIEARKMAELHADRRRGMRYKNPHELTLVECELIGFWLGDGTKSAGRVSLAQSFRYPDNIARVDELLRVTGIHAHRKIYAADKKSTNKSVRWTLARGTGGRGQETDCGYFSIEPYLEKEGTRFYWGLNRAQLNALLQGFWMADGNHHHKIRNNGRRIAGTQKALYEVLQAVCSVRGISATIRPTPLRECQRQPQYVFAWNERKGWRTHGRHAVAELTNDISERVWCVTSSTSFLICKRRGKVFVTGNTTGFNVPAVDLLVMRRRTKSLGLYIQIVGRALRTAPGKEDCAVLDFAGNIDAHGPLDAIRPKDTAARLVSCESCGKRNAAAARQCWSCDAIMCKLCPACLVEIPKAQMVCGCGYDMSAGPRQAGAADGLLEVPTGAALLSSYKTGVAREGGWLPVRKAWQDEVTREIIAVAGASQCILIGALADAASAARWLRLDATGAPCAVLVPNGASRTSARQISADGSEIIVPLPAVANEVAA